MLKLKNKFKTFAIILLVAVFFNINSACQQTAPSERVINVPQQTTVNNLPNMNITTLEGKHMTLKDHKGKAVLILFQPECEDCQREAVQIRNNLDAFNAYTLYFISSAPLPQISEFRSSFNLQSFENIIFAQTTVQNVINTLGPIPAPSVYIYSNEGKLVKYFNGEVEIELIKNAL
jgi:peroxiredoxin